jgi:hypothetical protein
MIGFSANALVCLAHCISSSDGTRLDYSLYNPVVQRATVVPASSPDEPLKQVQ